MKSNDWKDARKYWMNESPIKHSSKQDLFIELTLLLIILLGAASIMYDIFFTLAYPKMEARYSLNNNWLGSLVAVDGWQTSNGYMGGHIFANILSLVWMIYVLHRYVKHKTIPTFWMVSIIIGSIYIASALPEYKEHVNRLDDYKDDLASQFHANPEDINIKFNFGAFLYFYQFYFELAFTLTPLVIVGLIIISQNVSSAGRYIEK